MKIVMLSVAAGSNDVRIMKEAKSLVKLGAVVTVVGKKSPEHSSSEEWIDDVKIIRVEPILSLSEFNDTSSLASNKQRKKRFVETMFRMFLSLAFKFRGTFFNRKSEKALDEALVSAVGPEGAIQEDLVTKESLAEEGVAEVVEHQPNKFKAQVAESWVYENLGVGPVYRTLRWFAYALTIGLYRLPRTLKNKVKSIVHRGRKKTLGYIRYLALYFVTAEELCLASLSETPDIIHAHDLYTLPAAVRVAERSDAKLVYDAHEFERYRRPGMTRTHRRVVKTIEDNYAKNARGVITVSDSIAIQMQNNLKITMPTVVYNSPPMLGVFENNPASNCIRTQLGLAKETPLAVNVGKYFDIFNHDQKVYLLIESLNFTPEFHLAILGYKTEKAELEIRDHARLHGVADRVHSVNPVNFDQVSPFISSADIGVYSIPKVSRNADYSMPNKLFELTLAGLPIAIAETTDAKAYMEEVKMGVFMDAWDPKAIAVALDDVYQRKQDFVKSKKDLETLRRKFGWEAQVTKIMELYGSLGHQLPVSQYSNQVAQFVSLNGLGKGH